MDEVKNFAELRDVLASEQEDSKVSSGNEIQSDSNYSIDGPLVKMDWSADSPGTKPKRIIIDGQEHPAATWKLVYISICEFLCKMDLARFKKVKIRGKKREYFSESDKGLAVPYYLEEADLYMEVNLNALTIKKNIKALMEKFNIDLHRVKIIIEKD